jgi:hypothetical protein
MTLSRSSRVLARAATTAFDTPIVIPILANDSDAEGDPIILRSLDLAGTVGSSRSLVEERAPCQRRLLRAARRPHRRRGDAPYGAHSHHPVTWFDSTQ